MHSQFIEKSRELGFIALGVSAPERPLNFNRFTRWISERKNAGMSWLEKNIELREDPSRLLQGCKAIISLAFPYPSRKPFTPDGFSVARYCQPDKEDYHRRLKNLCRELVDTIKEIHSESVSRVFVDSAPILERSFGLSAGIGFVGKNNMLIIPGYGSYFYLAEILTTAPFDIPRTEPIKNQCLSCTLCIDSCPTKALERPFSFDAARCLSYLTIEHRGDLTDDIGRRMGNCFLGCDRCQEVCPFNGNNMEDRVALPSTDLFLGMDEKEFRRRFGKSAFERPGLDKIKRNLRAITRE